MYNPRALLRNYLIKAHIVIGSNIINKHYSHIYQILRKISTKKTSNCLLSVYYLHILYGNMMIYFLFIIVLVFLVTTLVSISKADTSEETLSSITHCTNSLPISPSNIHILMMGSKQYLHNYQMQVRSFQEYCKLHGYNFHARDQDVVQRKVGIIRSDVGRNHIVSSKPLFIHCKRRGFAVESLFQMQ